MRKSQNFKTRYGAFCGLLLLAVIVSSSDAAVELNGTFGFTPVGDITYSGTSLQDASSITLPATEVINTVPPTYNANPNDFFTGPGSIPLLSQVTMSPLTLVLPAIFGSFSAVSYPDFLQLSSGTVPNDRYDFSLLELMKTSNGPSGLDVYGMGTVHDTLGVFADTPGVLSIAFTQSGQMAAINASFSVATAVVPEPGTLAAGLCALGLVLGGLVFRSEARSLWR